MKPKIKTCINSSKEINDEYPKFKLGDIVRLSKYKNIFVKDYIPNQSEEAFVIEKVKNTVPWTYVISDLKNKKKCEKELQKNKSKRVYS